MELGSVAALTQRARGRSRTPTAVTIGFVAGAFFAALVVPSGHKTSSGPTGLAAGVSAGAGGSAGSGFAGSGGSTAAGGPATVGGTQGGSVGGAATSASGGGTSAATAAGSSGVVGGSAPNNVATASTNGGATAVGVSATAIRIGIMGADSSGLGAACPRCGQGGMATEHDNVESLLAAWRKDHKLPINGRDFQAVYYYGNDVSPESAQSGCTALAGMHPFLVSIGPGLGGAEDCLTSQNHIITLDGGLASSDQLQHDYPYLWSAGAALDSVVYNMVGWADDNGLLKGKILGLYSPNTATIQSSLNKVFRKPLRDRGYKLSADVTYNQQGQSDDSVAVAKMRQQNVNVMFTIGAITEPSGFQNQAEAQSYRPKYPIPDLGYSFTDALADVSYNANAQDGNLMYGTRWWSWSSRNPATPKDNPTAAYCLKAYEDYTHTNLDVYSDDAKIRYLLDVCAQLELMRQAVVNSPPQLTQRSWVQGIAGIQNMQLSEYWGVSFSPTKLQGSDYWATALFKKARWQPENDYIRVIGPWTRFVGH